MALSQHAGLQIGAKAFALIAVGFGVNALFRPEHALSFFEWEMPTTLAERQLVESLLYAYGVRDIFWGFATWIAAAYGNPKTAGWTLVGGSAVAFADGIICYSWGHGQWGHWSYAPIFTLLGATLLGVFDKA